MAEGLLSCHEYHSKVEGAARVNVALLRRPQKMLEHTASDPLAAALVAVLDENFLVGAVALGLRVQVEVRDEGVEVVYHST